ncbi:hypothetical protein GALMADRAFT_273264 [Galerina marginata CBS 339.88]|uniref:Uncharacterized protein n=1 Tax=Galerina marginata (strain CBS 339.88) TaxID=685588 RepID=A0A067SHT0_GALM3|nr:hypothetical protein GALMADRAFT_273264 [Galerina marginata CBS 339.88]
MPRSLLTALLVAFTILLLFAFSNPPPCRGKKYGVDARSVDSSFESYSFLTIYLINQMKHLNPFLIIMFVHPASMLVALTFILAGLSYTSL